MTTQSTNSTRSLFKFTEDTSASAWSVEDDTVMGGRSSGHFTVTDEGHGRFHGEVSLENDGGFSSIRHAFDEPRDVGDASSFQLRLRGDGKDYTLRVKSDPDQEYYHEATFPTQAGKWETVAVPFASMEAVHHGEPVDVPNYGGQPVTEFQFLIGNKKAQTFEVLLDEISAL